MIEIIDETIRCLLVPYFGILVIGLLLLVKRKEFYFLLFCVATYISWRSFFRINTSRYCASSLIGLGVILPFVLSKTFLRRNISKATIIITSVLVAANIYHIFSSFRTSYIFDIRSTISRIASSDDEIFIESKDFGRLSNKHLLSPQKEFSFIPLSYDNMIPLYTNYNFWEKGAYLIIPQNKKDSVDFKNVFRDFQPHKVFSFISNKDKSKAYHIYHLDKYHLPNDLIAYSYNDEILKKILQEGSIKTGSFEHKTLIFECYNKLNWIIGSKINDHTEIIFHIRTDRPDLLPPKRIQYRFDNRGFRAKSKYLIDTVGKYRIYEQQIPQEYPITDILTGLNMNGNAVWFPIFHVENSFIFEE